MSNHVLKCASMLDGRSNLRQFVRQHMSAKKNKLMMLADDAAKHAEVSRATLYRWMKSGRIERVKRDGFTFVDLYQVTGILGKPRRSRGRKLAIQRIKKEYPRIVKSKGMGSDCMSVAMRFQGKMNKRLEHGAIDPISAFCIMEGLEKLLVPLRKLARGAVFSPQSLS